MRYSKLLLCVIPLLALGACDDDGITELGGPPPAAAVRFINVNVDTGTVDLTFIDRVENLPSMKGVAFRGTSGFYQRVGEGSRATRVFPYSTDINLTRIELIARDIPLAANQRYTFVYAGRVAAGAPTAEAARLEVLTDPAASELPAPGANQIALQALHVAVGVGNVDVYIVPVASAAAATPPDFATNNAGVIQNVPYLGRGAAYVTVPSRPVTAGALYRFVVTPTGDVTPLFAATPNQPGAPAPAAGAVGHGTVGAQPGVQISGSVLTAVVAPGATPGTRQATAANTTPTVFLMADKVLNP